MESTADFAGVCRGVVAPPALKKSSKSSTDDLADVVVVGFGSGVGAGGGFVVLAGSSVGGFDFGRTSTLMRDGVGVITGVLSRDSALAFDRNLANPTGDSGDASATSSASNRLADFDTDDSDDVDAIFSTDALFLGVDAMDTSPKISSNPSIKLSSSSAGVVCSRVGGGLVAPFPTGDAGLDPLTLLVALSKSNTSPQPSPPPVARAPPPAVARAPKPSPRKKSSSSSSRPPPPRLSDAGALANASRSPNEDDDAFDAPSPPLARASTRGAPKKASRSSPPVVVVSGAFISALGARGALGVATAVDRAPPLALAPIVRIDRAPRAARASMKLTLPDNKSSKYDVFFAPSPPPSRVDMVETSRGRLVPRASLASAARASPRDDVCGASPMTIITRGEVANNLNVIRSRARWPIQTPTTPPPPRWTRASRRRPPGSTVSPIAFARRRAR
jgi:hypothetical protein